MNLDQIITTPAKQFPLRLDYELARELDQCAKDMNLTKTALSKIAIKKLLAELQKSGARNYMKELIIV